MNLETMESSTLQWSTFDNTSLNATLPSSAACQASFDESCPHRCKVAFYNSGDIYILDIAAQSVRGILREPRRNLVKRFSFNPDPEKHLLAALYTGGGIALFDTGLVSQINFRPDMFANHVSWTTDGRQLIIGTGEVSYTLEVYKVQTSDPINQKLTCQVDHPGIPVTPLVIAGKNNRIISAHSGQSRIWEFPTLEEPELTPVNDEAYKHELLSRESWATTGSRKATIAVMSLSGNGRVVMCGTDTGEVVVFSALDGSRLSKLHQRHSCAITSLVLAQDSREDLVITGDEDVFVVIAKVLHERCEWGDAEVDAENRCGNLVEQLLLSPSETRVTSTQLCLG
ncbi:hypothetical protein V8C35DRAFT_25773 [Trichoderma chlorosporum]